VLQLVDGLVLESYRVRLPGELAGGPQRPASEAVRQDYGAAAWCEVTVAVHARNVTVESYRAAARTCRRKPAA